MEAIFAATSGGAFGMEGTMPWPSIKEDFANFKKVTMGKTLSVAKTTLFTLPELKGRTLKLIGRNDEIPEDSIIIGGTSLLTVDNLKKCKTIYFTLVEGDHYADTFIPKDVMEYVEEKCENAEVLFVSGSCTIFKITNEA